MTEGEFAAAVDTFDRVRAQLTATHPHAHGRESRHPFGGCPTCRRNVCLAHHDCPTVR